MYSPEGQHDMHIMFLKFCLYNFEIAFICSLLVILTSDHHLTPETYEL